VELTIDQMLQQSVAAQSFAQNSMYRGPMEPTWTSGSTPGVGALIGRSIKTGVGWC
jgi:hypothetical protein